MEKVTKGTIAAIGAAALLLGGGTTLAYWTATETIPGGEIAGGRLSLDVLSCDGTWEDVATGTPVTAWVPGDSVEQVCTYTIVAEGENLTAELEATDEVSLSSAGGVVTGDVTVAYTLGGNDLDASGPADITSTNNGETLVATVQVDFPFGDGDAPEDDNGNDAQGIGASLDGVVISLEQTNPDTAP